MGILFHLLTPRSGTMRPFQYIGISTKTCFLCSQIIEGVESFSTRGSPRKVYFQWTLPRKSELLPHTSKIMKHTLIGVVKNLRMMATQRVAGKYNQIPESSAAMSETGDFSTYRHNGLRDGGRERANRWLETISQSQFPRRFVITPSIKYHSLTLAQFR